MVEVQQQKGDDEESQYTVVGYGETREFDDCGRETGKW